MKVLFSLTVIGITYGSLYPFEFAAAETTAFNSLLESWKSSMYLGDRLANIVLFVPFGFFGMLAIKRPRAPSIRIITVVVLGLLLGVALQVAQLFVPGRDASLQDAQANLLGTVVGGLAGTIISLQPAFIAMKTGSWNVPPLLLIGSWFAYRLMPFIPILDWQQINSSLKPLLLSPHLSTVPVLHDAVAWAIVAHLWSTSSSPRLPEGYLILAIPLVFGLEILTTMNFLTVSDVLGAVVGLALWWGLIKPRHNRAGILAASLTIMLLIHGLSPFEWRLEPAEFHWLPFYGMLEGPMMLNTSILFKKFFFYGALIWLLCQTIGSGLWVATLYAAAITAAIELMQVVFTTHTPEITDPLLVVIIALIIHVMSKRRGIMTISPRCLHQDRSI